MPRYATFILPLLAEGITTNKLLRCFMMASICIQLRGLGICICLKAAILYSLLPSCSRGRWWDHVQYIHFFWWKYFSLSLQRKFVGVAHKIQVNYFDDVALFFHIWSVKCNLMFFVIQMPTNASWTFNDRQASFAQP